MAGGKGVRSGFMDRSAKMYHRISPVHGKACPGLKAVQDTLLYRSVLMHLKNGRSLTVTVNFRMLKPLHFIERFAVMYFQFFKGGRRKPGSAPELGGKMLHTSVA